MGLDLQLISIPIFTVTKVLLVAFIGGFAGKHFSHPLISAKGISTMTVKIFLPAMLFSRMAMDMSMDLLRGGYGWAIVLCFVPLTIGHLSANLLKYLIKDKEFHALFLLGSTFHNVVSFGLGVTQSLAGPKWINAEAYAEFATVVFLWNLPHSLLCFGWGTMMVRNGKEDEIRSNYERDLAAYENEKALREQQQQEGGEGIVDVPPLLASVDGSGSGGSSGSSAVAGSSRNFPSKRRGENVRDESPRNGGHADEGDLLSADCVEAIPVEEFSTAHIAEKYTDGKRRRRQKQPAAVGGDSSSALLMSPVSPNGGQLPYSPLVSSSSSPMMSPTKTQSPLPPLVAPTKPSLPPQKEGLDFIKAILVETLTNITNAASLFGITIGLVPILRWIMTENPFGRIFIESMDTLGGANVPLTLLQLGTNLTSAQKAPKKRYIKEMQTVRDEDTGEMVTREVQVEAPPRGFIREYIDNLEVPLIFIGLVALIRLVIIPTCFLAIFLTLRSAGNVPLLGPIPSSKAFQMTVLIESCGPTAINTNILCTMFQYKTTAYSQALLGIYVLSIGTTAIWLSLYLWLLGDE